MEENNAINEIWDIDKVTNPLTKKLLASWLEELNKEHPKKSDKDKKEILNKKLRDFFKKNIKNRIWRLVSWHVYMIKDKDWFIVPFKPNKQQIYLLKNQHHRNVILKARQLGFSTLIEIQVADAIVFNDNTTTWVIADTLSNAQSLFRDKLKFAIDNIPHWVREELWLQAQTDSKSELFLSNGSMTSVSTSYRWGTLQVEHISEFWKICANDSKKAREIVTGAFNAVPKNWMLFIESTAEGNSWYFYDIFKKAWEYKEKWKKLSPLDFKPFFFPRHEEESYRLDDEDIIITSEDELYFNKLATRWIELDESQKKWYVKMKETQWDDMWREYPSYWEEAFDLAVKWAFYERELSLVRRQDRICKVPYDSNLDVYAAWDLWWASKAWDETAIWFFQLFGNEIRIIDYWEGNWYSILEILNHIISKKPYKIEKHYLPHDSEVTEMSTGVRRTQIFKKLWHTYQVIKKAAISDWIDAVRTIFNRCYFDEEKTAQWIKCLSHYQREWDEKNWVFKPQPLHNRASHGADAFRYLATALMKIEKRKNKKFKVAKAKRV